VAQLARWMRIAHASDARQVASGAADVDAASSALLAATPIGRLPALALLADCLDWRSCGQLPCTVPIDQIPRIPRRTK
jgi:hypothetical protein